MKRNDSQISLTVEGDVYLYKSSKNLCDRGLEFKE